MIIDEVTPIQYPPGYDTGPWGVCSIGMYWWVVNRDTMEKQQIVLIGKSDMLSQAMEEASRRNRREALALSTVTAPQPQAAVEVKEAQVAPLTSPKG